MSTPANNEHVSFPVFSSYLSPPDAWSGWAMRVRHTEERERERERGRTVLGKGALRTKLEPARVSGMGTAELAGNS